MRLVKMLQAKARTPRGTEATLDVPRTFLGFLEWVDVTPSPGQAELARVAYDGAEPVDRALAERIYGGIDFAALPVGIRRVFVAVVGARGGKSYLLIALRLVWGMLVRDLSVLAPGELAYATVVAPNDRHRQHVINFALGVMRSRPELRRLLRLPQGTKADSPVSAFDVYRPDHDAYVRFWGAVASAGGNDVRGKWHTDVALDECAFFRDATSKINDEDIFEAAISRVLPGGQCILGSTPWAQAGVLYQLWRDNYGKPDTALVAHCPTLTLNDRPDVRLIVEHETKRNPDNAAREYDAQFMTTGTSFLFESSTIEAALTSDPFELRPGDDVRAGGDFGFLSDSSALVLVARRGNVLHIFDGAEERPQQNAPLKPSVTVDVFAKTIAGRCRYLMADGHYRASIEEHLQHYGLDFALAPAIPADAYMRARMLMRETGRVVIHPLPFRDRLLQQLREVHARPTAGGRISIHNPRWAEGGHGDIASAFVLALWQVSGDTVPAAPIEEGSKEWEAAQREKRRQRHFERQNRPFWKKAS